MVKTCSKCKTEKELNDFPKDKMKKDGLSSHCKACRSDLIKNWKKSNPDRVKAINNKYNNSPHGKAANKGRFKKYMSTENFKIGIQNWRDANKERYAKSKRERGRRYNKKQVDVLGDAYVKDKLRRQGFPSTTITNDLIEIKKLMLKTKREIIKHENKD